MPVSNLEKFLSVLRTNYIQSLILGDSSLMQYTPNQPRGTLLIEFEEWTLSDVDNTLIREEIKIFSFVTGSLNDRYLILI